AAQHAAATSAALGAAGAAVYGKAREAVPQSVQERFPERSTAPGGTGTGAGGKRNVDMMPVKETATLPSGDKGQGPMGGVGSLPGGRDEEGVALLPEEKAHPDPTLVDNAGAKRNIHLVSPYDTESPYSDVEANKIAAPPSAPAPIGLAGKAAHLAQSVGASGVGSKFQEADESHRFKGEEKVHQRIVTGAVDTSLSSTGGHPEKVNVQSSDQTKGGQDSASSDETRKKPSFMDKLKGEAKIFSGKLGKNEEKVEEGRALKMGVSPVSPTYTK
ncbi:uncharacterized protein EI90DRAFT_3085033, partial [Cantharellus anzutake]|uniref:uncharacterized protein n=1 Tax=Cantharellus anzutake TaxID=1750568 RepID=UPI001906627C